MGKHEYGNLGARGVFKSVGSREKSVGRMVEVTVVVLIIPILGSLPFPFLWLWISVLHVSAESGLFNTTWRESGRSRKSFDS